MRSLLLGLRARLLALVLLALLPLAGLMLFSAVDQRERDARTAKSEVLRLAKLTALGQARLVEEANHLLLALAEVPQVRDGAPSVCSAYLAGLLGRFPAYTNLGVAAPDGDVLCSAMPLTGPVNVADRAYFRRAVESGEFAVGEYQVGRITKKPGINFGLPLVGEDGRLRAVVFAAHGLSSLEGILSEATLPAGGTVVLLDDRGTILARYPELAGLIGRQVPQAELVQAVLAGGEGVAEADGLDGVRRFYGFTGLPGQLGSGGVSLAVGVPKAGALANADDALRSALVVLAIVMTLALAATWTTAQVFIVRPLVALTRATRRLREGDLASRSGLRHGPSAVGELALAFDETAETLEWRTEELARLNEELELRVQQRTAELQAATDELEQQNMELELQAVELEEKQAQLAQANDELEARQGELERALAELAEEKERVEVFYRFGDVLAGEIEVEAVARNALTELAEFAEAEIGTVYAIDEEREGACMFVASRGVEPSGLPAELLPGEGLAGRALVEGRSVTAPHGATGLRLRAFGEEVSAHHELHVPLVNSGRALGVVTLARIADQSFTPGELQVIEHLADQAAVALANALAHQRALRLVAINRSVFDATPEGIALVDPEGRLVVANAKVAQLAETLGVELVGNVYEELARLAPRTTDPDAFATRIAALAANPGLEDEYEYEIAATGRTLSRNTKPVRNEAGEILGRLFVLRETTAERDAHRDLERARATLDAAGDGIGLADLEGTVLVVNDALVRISELHGLSIEPGVDGREIMRRTAGRTSDPEGFMAASAASDADPEHESVYTYQLAGSGRWFQRSSGPFRDESGRVMGRIFTVREVTAEREAEQLKSDLMATVSHELRTPLASILGFAELLAERDYDPDARQRYLGTIHNEAKRLTELINDFLDLQRIEEGQFTVDLRHFDLGDLLREELELYSAQSGAHTIELESSEDEEIIVVADRNRVAQVIGNLLSNAIKYSPAGGEVRVSVVRTDGLVRMSVGDSGIGIPAGQQRQIFSKFFRVDSSDTREIGGTGLGLALAKEIVEAHGGRIGFESEEGEGSTFWFELPSSGPSG